MQVVDASAMVAALVVTGRDGIWANKVAAGTEAAAPELMRFEAANIIRRTTVRGAIDQATGAAAFDRLLRVRFTPVPFDLIARRVWELRHNLTAYDAAYVAAAELLECRLVTLDRRLAKADGPRCEILTPDP